MEIDFEKYADGLVPAIVQDADTRMVLMLGFMNSDALELTKTTGKVTFYSRSRNAIWTKGETSGNFLFVESILTDCDNDTILIKAKPAGPTCHSGADTCFNEANHGQNFLLRLESLIRQRRASPEENSYTSELFRSGLNRIIQKVGEEAVELMIEAKDNDDERFIGEAADLFYHLLVLFAEKNIDLSEVMDVLEKRMK